MIARADDLHGQSARLAGNGRGSPAACSRRAGVRARRHALGARARPASERHAQSPYRRPLRTMVRHRRLRRLSPARQPLDGFSPARRRPWRDASCSSRSMRTAASWLWATSNQGLARFDGKQWTLLGRDAGLPDVDLPAWADSRRARSGRSCGWQHATRHRARRRQRSATSARAARGSPAAARPHRLRRAGRSQRAHLHLHQHRRAAADAGRRRLPSRVFTVRKDGMVHDECNTNAQFIDAHDRFWTGTLGGLTVYDPDQRRRSRGQAAQAHPRCVDGQPVASASGHPRPASTSCTSTSHCCRGSARTSRASAPGWRLRGRTRRMDRGHFRDISALPHGDYVLRIEGRDYAGNLSTPIVLPINVVARMVAAAVGAAAGGRLLHCCRCMRCCAGARTRCVDASTRSNPGSPCARRNSHSANGQLLELSRTSTHSPAWPTAVG